MSEFRRLMMQQAAEGGGAEYVKDGLAFHLDCRDAQVTDGEWTWTDKIGKIPFAMHNVLQGEDKGLVFDGVDSYGDGSAYADEMVYPYDKCTLEICFEELERSSRYGLFFNSKNIGLFNYANMYYLTMDRHTGYTKPNDKKQSISVHDKLCIINASIQNNTRADYFSKTEGPFIGRYNVGAKDWFLNGKIYSIRLYDRLLTEQEMLQNQRADNINYNLELQLP